VSGILRIVKGDKGTAGTTIMVAPAGEFKPRTSAKVRFELVMNIYIEPAASASETATDSAALQAQSWRDTLPIHPAAELFPRMSEAELAALGKDIRKHGLTSPIAVWSDGKSPEQLLDGRSRLDAIEIEIGPAIVSPPSVMAGKDFLVLDRSVDPYAFVISANIQRRHLTAEQKREIVAALLKANPERSNNATAKIAKVDDKTVGAVRAELERRSEIPNVSSRTDSKGRKQPARKTTTKPPPVSAEVLQQREAAAGRIRDRTGGNKVRDDIGSESAGECERLRARNEELQAQLTHFAAQNIALRSEVEELKAVRKPQGEDEGEGEDSELGNLLRAWDFASQGAREKFEARVGLVAVEPPAGDGLDIPECLRRAAP